MIPRSVLHLRGSVSWAAHLASGIGMYCTGCRALLKKEIYGCWSASWSLMLGTRHTAIFSIRCSKFIAWCLQAKINLGLWLAYTRMTFDVRVCEGYRNGIRIILHGLIKLLLPRLISRDLLSLSTLGHVSTSDHTLGHVKTRASSTSTLFRAHSLGWVNLKLGGVFGASPWAFLLLLGTDRRSDRSNGALGVWKDLGKLLDGWVENSLLVVVVQQVYWLQGRKVSSSQDTLVYTAWSRRFLVHL